MNKKPVIIGASAVAIVLFIFFGYSQVVKSTGGSSSKNGREVEYTLATTEEAKEIVSNSGLVEIKDLDKQYASTDGRISEFYFEVGDFVNAGDVIYGYDEDTRKTLEESLRDAKYNLEIAEINLDNAKISLNAINGSYEVNESDVLPFESQVYSAENLVAEQKRQMETLEQEIVRANKNVTKAEETYKKQEILYQSGAISKVELESYKDAVEAQKDAVKALESQKVSLQSSIDSAEYSLDVANKNLNYAKNPGSKSTDMQKEQAENAVRISELNVEQAKNTVTKLEDKVANSKSGEVSEFTGYITSVYTPTGTTVQKGMPVFDISKVEAENLVVTLKVDQRNVSSLAEGQKVEIKSTGIGDEVVEGTVSKIMPTATVTQTANGNESKTDVEVSITGDLKGLKAGFIVDCNIIVEVNQGATFVPILSILSDEDGNNYVYVINEENKAEKRPVTIGTISGTNVEVDNVAVGEKVVSSDLKYIVEDELLNPVEAE